MSPLYTTLDLMIFRCKKETTNCSDLEKEVERMKFMYIILFILVFGIPLLKEAMEDAQYREECRRKGYNTYWSNEINKVVEVISMQMVNWRKIQLVRNSYKFKLKAQDR